MEIVKVKFNDKLSRYKGREAFFIKTQAGYIEITIFQSQIVEKLNNIEKMHDVYFDLKGRLCLTEVKDENVEK